MKKIARVLILQLILSLGIVSLVWAQEKEAPKKGFGMSLGPSSLRIYGGPGQTQTETIRISNNGPTPLTVVHEVSDVANQLDKDGNLVRVFLPPGSVPFSCAKWITVKEGEFVLGPGEFRDVSFLLSPPSDISGGKVGVIFFRGIPTIEQNANETNTPSTTIQVQPRLGVMIFYEVQGTVKRTGNLLNLSYEPPVPSDHQPLKITYEFENAGNADILLSGTFYILDQNKTLVTKGDLAPLRTFPGDKGLARMVWADPIEPGKYQLVVTLELGPEAQESIVREFEFTVK